MVLSKPTRKAFMEISIYLSFTMIRSLEKLLFSGLLIFAVGVSAGAQVPESGTADAAYIKVTNDRAAKIVNTLSLSDPQVAGRVQNVIAQQYRALSLIHEARKQALAAATEAAQKEAIESETTKKLNDLHREYLAKLATDLGSPQIDQIKNGMTYGVVPLTYTGYLAMLPSLTDAQKVQILTYLTEARERAMDEGTSEKKHAMFGKYKGRINNYLSAAGIDMKKASKEWEERIAEEAKKSKK